MKIKLTILTIGLLSMGNANANEELAQAFVNTAERCVEQTNLGIGYDDASSCQQLSGIAKLYIDEVLKMDEIPCKTEVLWQRGLKYAWMARSDVKEIW